jgi:Tfp pilus assembly protein PilX
MTDAAHISPATRASSRTLHRQRGTILVTSMLLLLVLTIIAVTAMQMTRMQERMAGNTRDVNLAFQGAEAALRDGELLIRQQNSRPPTCSAAPCEFWEPGLLTDIEDRDQSWWDAVAIEYEVDGDRFALTHDIGELARDPQFIVESLGFVPDSLTVGHGVPEGRDFFQVTGRSTGGSGMANTVLQTTFTRRF